VILITPELFASLLGPGLKTELSVSLFSTKSSESNSDSNSDSDSELTGGTVSRRGRPRDLEMARIYSKGR
jgi:hypothetical protein